MSPHLILFDTKNRRNLFPFTHTRPTADIRCGILTNRERWERILETSQSSTYTEQYLSKVYPLNVEHESFLCIDSSLLANNDLTVAIKGLKPNQCLIDSEKRVLAYQSNQLPVEPFSQLDNNQFECIVFENKFQELAHIWDIFSFNGNMIRFDFELLTKDKSSQSIPNYVSVIQPEQIFIEPGAVINPCILNASQGPIYIGKNAEVMDGSCIRGPFALCEGATIKMSAKIYGGTTIGPNCKVGGEVSNSVFFANSNKGHDGFIGNAVIGEWCNLGADTNCSNLKNNYDIIKIWHEASSSMINTHLQFCGLMMGDHSKSGINTMFNTGTVVGVSANVYGAEFPEKFIPSFSWGSAGDFMTYKFDKAMETAQRMMERRKQILTPELKAMYRHIFDQNH
jgi:UDP-N-acetylglucosamine diphosphorylase/glucosamine-1-phosphate N-acetyltransferase